MQLIFVSLHLVGCVLGSITRVPPLSGAWHFRHSSRCVSAVIPACWGVDNETAGIGFFIIERTTRAPTTAPTTTIKIQSFFFSRKAAGLYHEGDRPIGSLATVVRPLYNAAMDLKRVDRVFRILPKEGKYYELFDVLVGAVVEWCELLVAYFAADASEAPSVEALKAIEHRGDETTREIMTRLQKSFVTPIDRDDIHALATALDDILDDAFAAASFAEATALGASNAHLRALSTSLLTSVREIYDAVEHLNDRDGIGDHCAAVHRVESEADEQFRAAMRDLFAGSPDPLRVIRLKELYERIEGAIDRSEDVANILETIVIKNS